MRRKHAKKSIELADESVRGVVKRGNRTRKSRTGSGSMPLKNVELLTLGRRIRRARKLLGFSQKAFATKSVLDRSYLGRMERGDLNIKFSVLCDIYEGLACDIATDQRHC